MGFEFGIKPGMNDDLEGKLENVKPSRLRVVGRVAKKVGTGTLKTLAAYLPNEIYSKVVEDLNEQGKYFKINNILSPFVSWIGVSYFVYINSQDYVKAIGLGAMTAVMEGLCSGSRFGLSNGHYERQAGHPITTIPYYTIGISGGFMQDAVKGIKGYFSNTVEELTQEETIIAISQERLETQDGQISVLDSEVEETESGGVSFADERVGALSVVDGDVVRVTYAGILEE
jgi:hypothetical protein